MTLTWKALTSARPGATFSDPAVSGLRYRVRRNGIFAEYRYKAGDQWRSIALGALPPLDGLASGRGGLEQLLEPTRAAARSRRGGPAPRGGLTLKSLIDDYVKHAVADQRPRTRVERERHLTRDWKPFHARPAAELRKADIADQLLKIKADHGPIAANRSRATLHAMFTWAEGLGKIDEMPRFPAKVLKVEPRRDRVLSLEELRTIWTNAGNGDFGAIVRLLILTGQRRNEVGQMRRAELDLGRALWSLPGARTKNGKSHLVPLARQAVALLRAVKPRERCDYVFGEGAGPFSGWSRCKRRLDERIARQRAELRLGRVLEKGEQPERADYLAPWTLHDVRRSWATHVNEMIGAPHVVEAALNHLSGHKAGVAGTYNKASWLPERVQAMQLWADLLEASLEAAA
jgi:integrase